MEVPNELVDTLVIKESSCFNIDQFFVTVKTHLGNCADIYYFQVLIRGEEEQKDRLGLLRVGSIEGGLQRELELRKVLGDYKMLSPLLIDQRRCASVKVPCAEVFSVATSADVELSMEEEESPPVGQKTETTSHLEESTTVEEQGSESQYLQEEYHPIEEIGSPSSTEKLMLLSYLPPQEETLAAWLQSKPDLELSLAVATQICQFCNYVWQRRWCIVQIFPPYIHKGECIQFGDLTGAYPMGKELGAGLEGLYCPPELAFGSTITEKISTYIVGAILYQALHHQPPPLDSFTTLAADGNLRINQIPRIHQLLSISLSPIPEDRFSLSQLLNLLVTTRKYLQKVKVKWEIASVSTVGLSPNRLENEDSYGVRQTTTNNLSSLMLGMVADGMGGMAKGEVASQTAVQTILDANLAKDLSTPQNRAQWLIQLMEQANQAVDSAVEKGGTTLSIVLAVGRELNIAHVGDSRIFLLRNGRICQLSEDHSLVAMLLASAQITYEESLDHPDRSMLIKSLGSKPRLSNGYVQDLRHFSTDLSLTLADGDLLIICSDGVWDLVQAGEIAEIFDRQQDLSMAVDRVIQQVIEKGANDNATILALKCHLQKPSF